MKRAAVAGWIGLMLFGSFSPPICGEEGDKETVRAPVFEKLLESIRDPKARLTKAQERMIAEFARTAFDPAWVGGNAKKFPVRGILWGELFRGTGESAPVAGLVPLIDRIYDAGIPPEKAHVCSFTGKRTPYAFHNKGSVDIVSVVTVLALVDETVTAEGLGKRLFVFLVEAREVEAGRLAVVEHRHVLVQRFLVQLLLVERPAQLVEGQLVVAGAFAHRRDRAVAVLGIEIALDRVRKLGSCKPVRRPGGIRRAAGLHRSCRPSLRSQSRPAQMSSS